MRKDCLVQSNYFCYKGGNNECLGRRLSTTGNEGNKIDDCSCKDQEVTITYCESKMNIMAQEMELKNKIMEVAN